MLMATSAFRVAQQLHRERRLVMIGIRFIEENLDENDFRGLRRVANPIVASSIRRLSM